MPASRKPSGRARSTALLVGRAVLFSALATLTTGCASWHLTEQTPQQVFAAERPSKIRVTTSDGGQTVLTRPRVLGDVVAGYDDECVKAFGINTGRCEEMGIAVFEISTFELHRRGPAAIIVPGLGGLLAVWLLANR